MIIIDKWLGLVTNASPYGIPPGAMVVQQNWQCRRDGELVSRSGQTSLAASTHTAGASPIISMFRAPLGSSECVVYQNADGQVRVARGIQ